MHKRTSSATLEQRKALAKMSNTLRQMIEDSITIDADCDQLNQINQLLDQAALQISLMSSDKRTLEYYNPNFGEVMNDIQPYSAISGVYNAVAGPIIFARQQNKIIGKVTYGLAYEGPPNCVHGGIIAGVYDQLMAIASMESGMSGPTAYLHIDYKHATPLFAELEFHAWIAKQENSKVIVEGQCLYQGKLVSTAQALFIVREDRLK